jgi:hypothetical protein
VENVELLRALLPVLWAVVSTFIGLVLYRSSAAFFEQTRQKPGSTRKIRLVGSICIAAIAFYGLRESTPTALLTGVPKDSQLIRSSDLQGIVEAAEQADSALLKLTACANITQPSQCQAELSAVRDRISQVRDLTRATSK